MDDVALDAVVVKDALVVRNNGLASAQIHADKLASGLVSLLQLYNGVLGIKSGVLGQDLGDDQEGIGVRLH